MGGGEGGARRGGESGRERYLYTFFHELLTKGNLLIKTKRLAVPLIVESDTYVIAAKLKDIGH